ncbi:MAG: cytochrome C biosynthesis protein [Phycisphaerae bacterium]|nr:cytochrome C biosynthesis protein [Phycisphaerae bacterium]
MRYQSRYLLMIFAVVGLTAIFYVLMSDEGVNIETYTDISGTPPIYPDYTDLVIPSNIAPLNFEIKEPGEKYYVRIYTSDKQEIEIVSKESEIKIPLKKWRKLLRANQAKELFYDIYVMNAKGGWQRYRTISNNIAGENEDIDSHLVYRRLKPNYNWFRNIGIYQRNLENFDESVVVHGKSFGNSCVNCHTFNNNSPESMIFGFRGQFGSDTIMLSNGTAKKLGTKLGYTTIHPSGKLVTCSINKVRQFFHFGDKMEVRDVVDLDSYITSYDVSGKVAKTTAALSDKQRLETYPTWSPDGKYLYFCEGPVLWADRDKNPPENYEKLKYDLMRIPYDLETDKWGSPETVLSSAKTGLSILLPRISPDGRFLLFCMCEYGCFPIYQPSSDLYMMDLTTREFKKLDVNSDFSESWHSWSSNGSWIVFSSKRRGGLFTRSYISYVDSQGKVHKPFILPQKTSAFYDSVLDTFSVPELVTGPIEISERELGRVIRSASKTKLKLPITSATPKVDTEGPWRQ